MKTLYIITDVHDQTNACKGLADQTDPAGRVQWGDNITHTVRMADSSALPLKTINYHDLIHVYTHPLLARFFGPYKGSIDTAAGELNDIIRNNDTDTCIDAGSEMVWNRLHMWEATSTDPAPIQGTTQLGVHTLTTVRRVTDIPMPGFTLEQLVEIAIRCAVAAQRKGESPEFVNLAESWLAGDKLGLGDIHKGIKTIKKELAEKVTASQLAALDALRTLELVYWPSFIDTIHGPRDEGSQRTRVIYSTILSVRAALRSLNTLKFQLSAQDIGKSITKMMMAAQVARYAVQDVVAALQDALLVARAAQKFACDYLKATFTDCYDSFLGGANLADQLRDNMERQNLALAQLQAGFEGDTKFQGLQVIRDILIKVVGWEGGSGSELESE